MGSYLKLIGSFLIGGLILLNIYRFTAFFNENSNEKFLDSITAGAAAEIVKVIEFDFNRMGLGVYRQEETLLAAQSDSIAFCSDFDEDGVIETITYFVSDSLQASDTENISDKILYRHASGEPLVDGALGVTDFSIRYFDWFGNETADLKQIKIFDIHLVVQSTSAYNDQFSTVVWDGRISPPNIRRY